MLTPDEKQAVEAELEHYPTRRAACIEALKIVQGRRGWVSDEAIRDLAPVLGMSPEELDNVATFYNLIFRRPVGRNVVLLCDSVSCWIMGCERIGRRLRDRLGVDLGGTTADGRFTLLPVACLGACERAPALMVNERLHTGLKEDDVDALIAEYGGDEE